MVKEQQRQQSAVEDLEGGPGSGHVVAHLSHHGVDTVGSTPKVANPAPIGLLAFGMTTIMLMYTDMDWVEGSFKDLVACYALFYGGMAQLVAGLFALVRGPGNMFAGSAFVSYGAFWLGWGFLRLKFKEGLYAGPSEFVDGERLFLIQWGIFTALFFCITLHKNRCLQVVFFTLSLTFILLAAGLTSDGAKKAGGYVGFFCGLSAIYTAIAEILEEEYGRPVLPGLKPVAVS